MKGIIYEVTYFDGDNIMKCKVTATSYYINERGDTVFYYKNPDFITLASFSDWKAIIPVKIEKGE